MYNQSPQMHCRTLGAFAPTCFILRLLLTPSPFQFFNPESSAKKKTNKAMPISSCFMRIYGFHFITRVWVLVTVRFRSICGGQWRVRIHRTPAC